MKNLVLFVAVSVALMTLPAVTNAAGKGKTDIVPSFIIHLPDDDEDWDTGYGAEVQFRKWVSDTVAFALALGLEQWDVEEGSFVFADPTLIFAGSIEGEAIMLPLGVSIIIRPQMQGDVHVTFEGGIRYVVVESDIKFDVTLSDPTTGESIRIADELEMDDGVVARIAVDVDAEISENVSIFGGIGLQLDIVEPETEGVEIPIESFFVRFGAVIAL